MTKRRQRRQGARVVLLFGAILAGLVAFQQGADAASVGIRSTGPLTRIEVSPTLSCAADHLLDIDPAFFADTACVTAVSQEGVLYRPDAVPIGQELMGGIVWPAAPDNQIGPTGAGTTASPYVLSTRVGTNSGLVVEQSDSYVTGTESWRTDVRITNRSATPARLTLYRAADCNLQNSDFGFGTMSPDGSVDCRSVADPGADTPTPGVRVERWTPITPGSRAYEGPVEEMWGYIGRQEPFPASCACDDYIDNAAGLSWDIEIAPGATFVVSSLLTISPTGVNPLAVAVVADAPTSPAGSPNGYTVTVTNPNAAPKQLMSLTDVIPDGFSYVAGSTVGAITADPEVDEQTLTWTGPITVPAIGTTTLHFAVRVSEVEGTYVNLAGADGGPTAVITAENAAPIVVGPATPVLAVDAGPPLTATEGTAFSVTGTVTGATGTPTFGWVATPGAGTDPGASCVAATPTAATTSFVCNDDGTYVLTLTASDDAGKPVIDSTEVTLSNAAPIVSSTPATVATTTGQNVAVTASVSDIGANDVATCTWSWGDGTTSTSPVVGGTCGASRVFTTAGHRDVVVTVTDDDGGTSAATIVVEVAAAPVGQSVAITFTGGLTYQNSARATTGRIDTVTDAFGVQAVRGTVTIPGVRSSMMTITVEVNRLGPFPLWLGSISWKDGGFDGRAPLISGAVPRAGATTTLATSWFAGKFAWRPFDLRLSVVN